MPGNFMVEACIEALSFYLAALGHTTRRDGWRFQPLPELPIELKCRGEINPRTQRVAYELHVEEVWDGPHPTVIADVIGFVDGRAAFHAHRIGVELVPDWPLTSMPALVQRTSNEPVEVATDGRGFAFDWKAMISTAWGRPSDAFGSMYQVFDGTRRSPRLPGEPYHFISRVTRINGDLNECKAGMEMTCEYDIPDDAWYFDANGAETMPFAVLLEAALQPCGWVASAVGSATQFDRDVLFRNLDGTGTLTSELTRTSGTLRTRVRLTKLSRAGGMIIEGFDVVCSLGDREVFTMTTVFGFFPPEAFVNQVGLAITDDQRDTLTRPGGPLVDLTERPERFCAGSPRLAEPTLLMLDRATHLVGDGAAGLGIVRGEKHVDVSEWFFKAHFFQDPVQPGSLGVEALLQLLQFYLLDTDLGRGVNGGHFEPIMLGTPTSWTYRGQVTPANKTITTVMEITAAGVDERGPYAIGTGSLWCDGLRIYEVVNMGMRIVPNTPELPALGSSQMTFRVDNSTHPHLVDHSVGGVPVVPVVYAMEWFARAAAAHRPDLHIAELSDLRVLKGLVIDGFADGAGLDVVVTVTDLGTVSGDTDVELELTDAATGLLRYRARGRLTAERPMAGSRLAETAQPNPSILSDVYGGVLFHGPSFQVIDAIESVSSAGLTASAKGVLRHDWPAEPWVTDPALLDGALQAALLWTEHLLDAPSLPTAISQVRWFAPPTGEQHTIRVSGVRATNYAVVCDIEVTSPDGRVTATLFGVETTRIPR